MRSKRDIKKSYIVLSVYFSGTSSSIRDFNALTALMYYNDSGFELEHDHDQQFNVEDHSHYKIGFNGSEFDHGWLGLVFGAGTEKYIDTVISKIDFFLAHSPGKKIIVNVLGFSRGGVVALLLAKKLGHYPPDMLEVNLALSDPVPGNLIISGECDLFNLGLASQALDLSGSHNLNRVFSLYTLRQTPAYYFHAPIRPLYPARTLVEEDYVPGSHMEIEKRNLNKGYAFMFVGPRILAFLNECKTGFTREFIYSSVRTSAQYKTMYEELMGLIKQEFPENISFTRDCHALMPEKSCIHVQPTKFFNQHHRSIVTNKIIEKSAVPDLASQPSIETLKLLKNLASDVNKKLSYTSRLSTKGKLLKETIKQIDGLITKDDVGKFDEKRLQKIIIQSLRIIVNISLQRDRYAYSFFGTTRSGLGLQSLLKRRKYFYFANIILGKVYHAPQYEDLLSFSGGFDLRHFNAANRDENLDKLSQQLNSLPALR